MLGATVNADDTAYGRQSQSLNAGDSDTCITDGVGSSAQSVNITFVSAV